MVLPPAKNCPRWRGQCRSVAVTKGERLKAVKLFYCSPSASLALSSSPVLRWSLFGMQSKLGVQCRTPSRSDRFNGVTGGAGGPKGRNRNLPWPPCKKVIKKIPSLLFISTPQSIRLTAYCQLPVEGSLLVSAIKFFLAYRIEFAYNKSRKPRLPETVGHKCQL